MKGLMTISFVLMSGASAALAQTQSDPQAGKVIAARECATCHDITSGGAFKTMPPSFASIAAFRAADEIEARIWYPAMHSRMPPMYFVLNPDEVRDVVAFIQSLERPAP